MFFLLDNIFLLIPILLMVLVILDFYFSARKASVIDKILWAVVVFLIPVLGLILYLTMGRKMLIANSNKAYVDEMTQLNRPVGQLAEGQGNVQQPNAQALSGQVMVQPPQLGTASKVIGIALIVFACISGFIVIGSILLVVVVMYECSRPGAKCM